MHVISTLSAPKPFDTLCWPAGVGTNEAKQMAGTSCPNLLSISLLFRTNLPFLITTSHASCQKQKNTSTMLVISHCLLAPRCLLQKAGNLKICLLWIKIHMIFIAKMAMFNGLAWHMLPSTGCATQRSRQSKELVNSSIPNSGRIRP